MYRKKSNKKIENLEYDKFDLVISKADIFLPELKKLFGNDKVLFISPGLRDIDENVFDKKTVSRRFMEIKRDIDGVKIVVLSKFLKDEFKRYFNRVKDVRVINPGVELRNLVSFNDRKNEVLFVGRITDVKNIGALVRVFDKTKYGKLLIVGEGPTFKELKKYIKKFDRRDDIELAGNTDNPEVYYDRAKIFVLPSKNESFGIVLIEAMAAGLPCIAFKPDGINIITASEDIIVDGKTGFLVKDEKEMAEKIDLLLSDNKLRKKLSVAARKEAEKYSWGNTVTEILKFAKSK